jgi:hypothetical protein
MVEGITKVEKSIINFVLAMTLSKQQNTIAEHNRRKFMLVMLVLFVCVSALYTHKTTKWSSQMAMLQ